MSITFYLEPEENLAEILKRIKETQENNISLVVPRENILLKNPLNLKILLSGAKKEKKQVSLIIFDSQGFLLAQKVGFSVAKTVGETPLSLEKETIPDKPHVLKREGFVDGKDIAEILSKEEAEEEIREEKKEVPPRKKRKPKTFFLVSIFLSLTATIALGGLLGVVWYLPMATVELYAESKSLAREENVIVSPDATRINLEEFTLPGLVLSVEEKGEKTVKVTGTKKVGEKAKGVVTVYNKQTDQSLNLPAGSLIATESGLKYAFNDEVVVDKATISVTPGEEEFIQTLTPGKATVLVTAVDIGLKYNLQAFVDKTKYNFTIDGYDKALAQAANREEISGGSSREVKIVSSDDKEGVLGALRNELSFKGKEDFISRLTGDQKLLNEVIKESVLSTVFSNNVEEEAENLTLNLILKIEATVYSESLLKKFFSEYFSVLVPDGYQLGSEIKIKPEVIAAKENGELDLFCKAEVVLWPKINKEEIKLNLAGKRPGAAEEYLKNLLSLKGYKIELRPNLPSFLQFLPKRVERIEIKLLEEQ